MEGGYDYYQNPFVTYYKRENERLTETKNSYLRRNKELDDELNEYKKETYGKEYMNDLKKEIAEKEKEIAKKSKIIQKLNTTLEKVINVLDNKNKDFISKTNAFMEYYT
jgi:chromosome segregation ATPase